MGTRSTFRVIESGRENGKVWKQNIMLMYMQFDGYPEGQPVDIAVFLNRGKLVNEISMDNHKHIFNGPGCLAAQLVSEFKDGPGGTYLYPPNHRGKCWENYLYDIIIDERKSIKMVAYYNKTDGNGESTRVKAKKFFEGTPEEFIKEYKGDRVMHG